jgi:membrane-associated phospholipid phosphatase
VIKQKDLWEGTGYFHPFVRMPGYILQDQKAIWTSPFHTAKKDVKLWAIFGLATAALIATDRHSVNVLPNSSSQVSVSTWGSRFGAAYTLIPVSAAFYFIGTPTHEERFRETGLICFESLIDSNIIVEAVKLAADRARPLENGGRGHFEDSPSGRWSSGFPSGHAISSWAMASVIAHQYPHPRIVPVLAYALAGTVVVSRVGARQHFPGDVVAGSAMGWFIGDYVYGRRHNRDLDRKPTIAEKLLDHVHLGVEVQ